MAEFIRVTGVGGEAIWVNMETIASVNVVTDAQRVMMQEEKGSLGYDYRLVNTVLTMSDAIVTVRETVDEIFALAKRFCGPGKFIRLPALFGEDYIVPVRNVTRIASVAGRQKDAIAEAEGEEFRKINAKVTFETMHTRESIVTTLTLDEIEAQLKG